MGTNENLSMQLYEVNSEILALLNNENLIDQETGEIKGDFDNTVKALNIKREALIHGVGLINRTAEADAATVDAEIKRLQAIKKIHAVKAEATDKILNRYVYEGEEFKFANLLIKWKKNPPRVENDEIDLNELQDTNPDIVKIEYSLDKNRIKEMKKNNIPLPAGIRVVQDYKLTIK